MKEPRDKPKDRFAGLTRDQRKSLEALAKDYAGAGPGGELTHTLVIEQQRLQFLGINTLKRLRNRNPYLYQQIATWIQFDQQPLLDAVRHPAQAMDPKISDEAFKAEKQLKAPEELMIALSDNFAYDLREKMLAWLKNKPDAKEFQTVLKKMQSAVPKPTPGE